MAKEHVAATFATMQQIMNQHMPPDLEFEFKHMFGGMGLYTRGHFFAVISSTGDLALKLPEADQRDLLSIDGAQPWGISPRQYIQVPVEFLDDADTLIPWLERSAAHAQTLPPPKKRKRRGA